MVHNKPIESLDFISSGICNNYFRMEFVNYRFNAIIPDGITCNIYSFLVFMFKYDTASRSHIYQQRIFPMLCRCLCQLNIGKICFISQYFNIYESFPDKQLTVIVILYKYFHILGDNLKCGGIKVVKMVMCSNNCVNTTKNLTYIHWQIDNRIPFPVTGKGIWRE